MTRTVLRRSMLALGAAVFMSPFASSPAWAPKNAKPGIGMGQPILQYHGGPVMTHKPKGLATKKGSKPANAPEYGLITPIPNKPTPKGLATKKQASKKTPIGALRSYPILMDRDFR